MTLKLLQVYFAMSLTAGTSNLRQMSRKLLCYCVLLCFFPTPTIPDTDSNDYCPIPDEIDDSLKITADQLSGSLSGHAKLEGEVQFEQGDNHLRANQISYDANTNTARAKGNVQYTSCNVVSPAWFINANQLILSEDQAVAKNAWFVFGDIPIAYFPRYRMALNNQRKSGFLTPEINDSSTSGFELGTPFYFNLAPNYDATFAPRWLSDRGTQFNGEYRYLSLLGEGSFRADWLDDRKHPDNRYSHSFKHLKAGKRSRLKIHHQRVSDTAYRDDFGGPLQSYQDNYLRSYVQLDTTWQGWQLSLLGEGLQTAEESIGNAARARPYERRPSLTLARRFFTDKSNQWDFQTHLTEFDYRGDDEADETSGSRFDNILKWQRPYRRPGFHFTPAASIRYTRYSLDLKTPTHFRNHPDDTITRTIPSVSLRTGLVFEKNKSGYQRTLEPELYYLKVPYRNQSDIPIYDTSEPEFRFNELFLDNRFRGTDRIADAEQISVALTHRILHSNSGKELLRASLGQIFYFRNQRVALNNEAPTNNSKSDIIAEFMFNLNDKLTFNNTLAWDTDIDRVNRTVNRISLNASNNRIINLFHRYQRFNYRQVGMSFRMPLTNKWTVLGGWSRDIIRNQDLLTLAGLEYQSCCWKIGLLGQRFLKNLEGDGTLANGDTDYDTSFGIELSFRNISTLGTGTAEILEKRIYGYKQQ